MEGAPHLVPGQGRVGGVRPGVGPLRVEGHHGVDGRILALDAVQVRLQYLDGGDLAGTNATGQLNGGAGCEVGHVAGHGEAKTDEPLLVRGDGPRDSVRPPNCRPGPKK